MVRPIYFTDHIRSTREVQKHTVLDIEVAHSSVSLLYFDLSSLPSPCNFLSNIAP
jgi:hypothetical protein